MFAPPPLRMFECGPFYLLSDEDGLCPSVAGLSGWLDGRFEEIIFWNHVACSTKSYMRLVQDAFVSEGIKDIL
jgi:hypothetical protein